MVILSDSPIMHWLSWCHIKWPQFWSCWLVHGDFLSCLGEVSSWDQIENKRRSTWNLKQPLQSVVSVALFKSFTWEIVVSPNNHLKWMFQVLVSGTSTNFDEGIPTGLILWTPPKLSIIHRVKEHQGFLFGGARWFGRAEITADLWKFTKGPFFGLILGDDENILSE